LHVPNPRSDRDALLAATALVNGMAVVTRNLAVSGMRTAGGSGGAKTEGLASYTDPDRNPRSLQRRSADS